MVRTALTRTKPGSKENGVCGQPSHGLLGGALVLVSLLQGGYLVRGGSLLPGRGTDVPCMRPAKADLLGTVFCESRGMLFHRLVALLSSECMVIRWAPCFVHTSVHSLAAFPPARQVIRRDAVGDCDRGDAQAGEDA